MPEAPAPSGAPFLRFNASIGWPLSHANQRSEIPDLQAELRLAIPGRSAIPMAEPKGTFGGRTLPRGLAITSGGRIFLADPGAHTVWTARVADASVPKPPDAAASWPFEPLWPAGFGNAQSRAGPYDLSAPTDVAMAPNGDLVILDPGFNRILVLAFPTAVLRHVIRIQGGAPTAVAFDAHGRAHVADPVNRVVYRFDRNWRRNTDFESAVAASRDSDFEPAFIARARAQENCGSSCGNAACTCASELPCRPAKPVPPAVYTLGRSGRVYGIHDDGKTIACENHDTLYLCPEPLRLADDGSLQYRDPAMPHHEPVIIRGLELTGDGRHLGTGLPLLARPRRVEVPRSGYFITDALDGGEPGFSWDRIAFRLDLPANTRLVLQTMTSDSRIEPDRVAAQPDSAWSQPLVLRPETPPARLVPEILIQSPPGRYLWVRVDLSGDGRRTPAIHELDVFAPRRSGLAELPAPFHQDPDSAHFLDRFLSYFDVVFAEIIARNDEIASLFDPDTTPSEDGFLDWLGAWFDLDFLAEWGADTRRDMIREAVPYYRMRGTVDGLRKILQWHTGLADPLPRIIEHFRLPPAGGGTPALMIGGRPLDVGDLPHHFTLVLPESAIPDAAAEERLMSLVKASVPAHCRFHVRSFVPGMTIGSQSSIGIDTLLGSLDPVGLGRGALGSTFSTPAPESSSPVRLHSHSQVTSFEGGYPC